MRVVIPQHKQTKIQKTNDNTICPSHSLCSQPVVKPSSSSPCSGLPTRVFPRATILASKSKPNSSYFLPLVTSQNPNTVFGFIRAYRFSFILFSSSRECFCEH